MPKKLFVMFVWVGLFSFFGAVSAKAQSNLIGKYAIEQKFDNGQTSRIAFELKTGKVAVYSKSNPAMEEFAEKTGSWTWNKSQKLLIVTIPAKDAPEKIVVTFKLAGKNLKVAKVSPASSGNIGDVFMKI